LGIVERLFFNRPFDRGQLFYLGKNRLERLLIESRSNFPDIFKLPAICSGQVQRAGGRLRFAQECSDCGGTGRRRPPCSLCKGKGTLPKTETVKVRIPAGVDTGSRVRIPGKGEGGRLGAPAGDLLIITNVGAHKYFKRKGDNIYVTVPITVPEAALGAKIEVPTIDGRSVLKIPPGTQSGQKLRLREKGVPSATQEGVRGDEIVEVKITVPMPRDEKTKELLRELAKLNPEDPREELWKQV